MYDPLRVADELFEAILILWLERVCHRRRLRIFRTASRLRSALSARMVILVHRPASFLFLALVFYHCQANPNALFSSARQCCLRKQICVLFFPLPDVYQGSLVCRGSVGSARHLDITHLIKHRNLARHHMVIACPLDH